MKKIIIQSLTLIIIASIANAKSLQSPKISSNLLILNHSDYISKNNKNIKKINSYFFAKADTKFKFNNNIQLNTNIEFFPDTQFLSNLEQQYQPYHRIANSNREFNFFNNSLIVEELNLQYSNEDLEFKIGKYNPNFGNLWYKNNRIGIYSWQFSEEYNVREKIGAQISALLENSKITLSSFINDTTLLSESAINKRGRADDDKSIPGNSNFLTSYMIDIEGQNLLNVNNLFYNISYKSNSTDNNSKTEKGYLISSQYIYNLTANTTIRPLFEIVLIDNLHGYNRSDALYKTFAIQANYSSWTTSLTLNQKDIEINNNEQLKDNTDIIQFSLGYQINKNLAIDITRARIEENKNKYNILGANIIFNKKF